MNLAVPLAARVPLGSECGATELRGTGPKAATIPGAPFVLFDRERFAISRYTTDLDVATRLEQSSVGRKRVPDTGAVAEPLSDDPDFPVACVFSFDIATSASDGETYLFSIGPLDDPIYFPIPIIPRADLEAAGWITNIGVNPQ